MNLFALTNDPSCRVKRFKISAQLQLDIKSQFEKQEQIFRETTKELIPFDGKYKPDLGEILYINEFDDLDGLEDAITNPLNVLEINPNVEDFNQIKAIFSGYKRQADGKTVILIQIFEKRRIISTNGISIFHEKDEYIKIIGNGLTLDSKLSAILEDGKLKFNSFHLMKQIFDMTSYYREATDSDIESFSMLKNIHVANKNVLIRNSDSWVRRKLWLISQSQILEKIPVNQIKAIATEFNIVLKTEKIDDEEKICIPDYKKELKQLLRFLDEDYYKSPLSNNGYISNSRRPITND